MPTQKEIDSSNGSISTPRPSLRVRLGRRLEGLRPREILSIFINVLTIPSLIALVVTKDSPGWYLVLLAWTLLVLAYVGRQTLRFTTELRDFERQVAAQEVRLERDSRMHSSFETFHDSFHLLRDIETDIIEHMFSQGQLSGDNRRVILIQLSRALTSFADFFSSHTGTHTRATIKHIISDGKNDLDVYSLCRSDPSGVPTDVNRVRLNLNSDFQELIRLDDRRWFFSEDLLEEKDYRNPTLGVPPRYRSTIVWPIRMPPARRRQGEEGGGIGVDLLAPGPVRLPNTIGFLCLDAKDPQVFKANEHVFLGAAFADALCSTLNLLTVAAEGIVRRAPLGPPVSARPDEGSPRG